MSVRIVFETHAWSVDNDRGIATGWLDAALSDRGRLEAHRLGARRLTAPIDAVFTSDLRRAVDTAELAFGPAGVPIHRDWRLRECSYGTLNGSSAACLERLRGEHVDVPFPAGESYRDVVDRVASFLAELTEDADDRDVVLVGHSATRFALDHLLTGAPLEHLVTAPFDWQPGWAYRIPDASPSSRGSAISPTPPEGGGQARARPATNSLMAHRVGRGNGRVGRWRSACSSHDGSTPHRRPIVVFLAAQAAGG